MQIRCPNCGNVCEADEEPVVGQHLLCPFCSKKFSYSYSVKYVGMKAQNTYQCIRHGTNGAWQMARREQVPDHLIGAVLALFLFLPLGIVAINFVMQSRQKLSYGDYHGAVEDSKTADKIVKIAVVIAMIGFGIWMVYGFLVGIEIKRTDDYLRRAEEEALREMRRANEAAERIIRSADYYY